MYERMLDKSEIPTYEKMVAYCGETSGLFSQLNDWLFKTCSTEKEIVFPYGNGYGWGTAHKKKNKLICNIFAESNAFTVMMRLTDLQFDSIRNQVCDYTREHINNRYPCGSGGWIHYRVKNESDLEDIKKLLRVKCE